MVTLLGQCFEIAVNEKQLKGGSSNMIVREYVFKLCPFHNITQHEPNYHAWVRAQERAKFRDPTTVDDDELAKLVGRSDSQAPIMIGLYNAFQNGHTLRYENGQKCGTIPRQAIVHHKSGLQKIGIWKQGTRVRWLTEEEAKVHRQEQAASRALGILVR